ncbi:MAG: (E)-4-hydroxy-3-methylbut-2-enyl-diphosphate synthase [Bacteroidales bacterium]|nr:(E)-4-hydroxy-3-methylbut-2-enyl-diphosphate synthase [Bacteroidales bacterium]
MDGYMSQVVKVGRLKMGGNEPVRVQSMTNTSTMDTEATYRQVMELHEAGCELVRMSVRNIREVDKVGRIKNLLESAGVYIPLAADIHFNPRLAETAATIVHKIRINPGNYLDRQYFLSREKDKNQPEVLAEDREEHITRLIDICVRHHTVIRVGVNHGSLSERILNRYGNTAEGMLASALEFLEMCKKKNFDNLIVSMKSSHVKTMINANLGIVEAMKQRGMHYPLHLGVTEAGEGRDGRIRSAAGIGPLLSMGLGDTIRVSLTEDPVAEIPVAKKLVDAFADRKHGGAGTELFNEISGIRIKKSYPVGIIGGDQPPCVVGEAGKHEEHEQRPDLFPLKHDLLEDTEGKKYHIINDPGTNLNTEGFIAGKHHKEKKVVLYTATEGDLKLLLKKLKENKAGIPAIIKLVYHERDPESLVLRAASDLSSLMVAGHGDGYWLNSDLHDNTDMADIVFGALQATGLRISGTEYISCPGCGRTSFDLQGTLQKIKQHTRGLKNVRIAVMGCIVNGPGEMAGADFGYVGEGNGRVSLYHKGQRVKRHIAEEDALAELMELINSSEKINTA